MENQFDTFLSAIKRKNKNTALNPMPSEKLNHLRLRKYRAPNRTETVPLPKSLAALLAYDCDLTNPYGDKVFEDLLGAIEENTITSWSPDEPVFYGSYYVSNIPGVEMEDLMPIWNDSPDLPALFSIAHPGDQCIWIYPSELDEDGEYPIIRQEVEEFWLSECSLMDYLSGIFEIVEEIDPENTFQEKREKYELRDTALLEKERLHEAFYEKMAAYED
ncbi:DUF5066 family protein [Xenorhabdus sp. 12]|uniref:DUF5066 family protein n=1 Tax=Xenorhabdus santafensis TaxID=2582833 RepID=A0ABU4S3R2_9GAMM|nr:DUF5066 family protein [Xenorhabdus sp. 12]MDX7985839.1 DUF5066 family protein [Xenorhabdus sp. 12]